MNRRRFIKTGLLWLATPPAIIAATPQQLLLLSKPPAAPAASQAAEYFGYGIGATSANVATQTRVSNDVAGYQFICPGSGSRVVLSLEFYCSQDGSSLIDTFRMAIYTLARALVCQGSAAINPNSNTPKWWAHSQANITPNPVYLTAGTHYLVTSSWVSADSQMKIYYDNGSANSSYASTTDYTGGFPDPLPAFSDGRIGKLSFRVQVQ